MTESEILKIINKVASRLAYKFRFGYHDVEDLKQQACVFGLQALDAYDGVRPLENFMWTHIRNRLYNYKRDNYERLNKPCDNCPLLHQRCNVCMQFVDREECGLYAKWMARNAMKRNLMETISFDSVDDTEETNMRVGHNVIIDAAKQELYNKVDSNIPSEFRRDWILLIGGARLSPSKLAKLEEIIRGILSESN